MPRNLITSDAAIRSIKPGDARRRLSDGDGLYLLLFVKGGAHGWRFDYSHQGKRKTISLGTYPDVTLSAARERASTSRTMVADGKDPSAVRQDDKARIRYAQTVAEVSAAGGAMPGTFKSDALAWIKHLSGKWSERTRTMIERQFEMDAYPFIGDRMTESLTGRDIKDLIKRVEDRGAGEQAARLLQRVKATFRHAAIHTESIESNVTQSLRGPDVLKPRITRHRAALPERELPRFWVELEAYRGDPTTVNALLLLLYTVPRPGELRFTPWHELPPGIDQWRIPADRMKMPTEHVIPLSRQAKAIIEVQRKVTGGNPKGLVFASPFKPQQPISENTLNSALSRMGYKGSATAHGFRGLFSTVCNEHDMDSDVIELCLAHVERDGVRAAYNAARKIRQRGELLQWWADFIDSKRPTRPIA
jgi:integrase